MLLIFKNYKMSGRLVDRRTSSAAKEKLRRFQRSFLGFHYELKVYLNQSCVAKCVGEDDFTILDHLSSQIVKDALVNVTEHRSSQGSEMRFQISHSQSENCL